MIDAGAHLVTQNVDGLHQLALDELGATDRASDPLELHGSLFRVRCTQCRYGSAHRGPIDASSPATLPRCPECASLLRPAVVWFGETLDPQVLSRAFELAAEADLCIVAGTSAVVHPAASVPLVTHERGGRIIEVNPEPTPLSHLSSAALRASAAEVLPALLGARA